MGRFVDLIRVMRDSCSRQMERVELAHLLVEQWAYTVLRILVRTPRRCYLTAVVKIARHFQGHRMPRLDVDQIFAMIDKDSLKVELVGPARLSKELKTEEEHADQTSVLRGNSYWTMAPAETAKHLPGHRAMAHVAQISVANNRNWRKMALAKIAHSIPGLKPLEKNAQQIHVALRRSWSKTVPVRIALPSLLQKRVGEAAFRRSASIAKGLLRMASALPAQNSLERKMMASHVVPTTAVRGKSF